METISRLPLTRLPQRPVSLRTHVSARTVALFLGIKETTVYTLIRGIRGWQRIEALPYVERPNPSRRDRYSFFLEDIKAWRERTQFKVQPQGRGRKRGSPEEVN